MERKPKIRFRGFYAEWKDSTLVENGVFKSNGVDKKISPEEKCINLLNYVDVYNNKNITRQNCNELMQVTATNRQIKENNVEAGDVFFTPTSETAEDIGHVAVIKESLPNTCYSYHLMRYRPNPGVFYLTFPNYSFASKQVRKQLIIEAQGVQRFVLRKEKFESTLVSIPSYEEQKKIAQHFDSLIDLIDSKKAGLEKFENLKKACMERMFPLEGETTPQLRFKGFNEEWSCVALNKCLEISKEKNLDNYYGINDVLSVSDDFGVVNQIKLLGRSYAGKSVSNYGILKNGQIVYTKSPLKNKPYGIVKYNDSDNGIVSVLYAIYIAKPGICPLYIHYYFDPSWRLNNYLRPLISKGAKNTINISDEMALTGYIMIPKNIAEQEKIASYFRHLDELIAAKRQEIEKLQNIKQSLLDKMFV